MSSKGTAIQRFIVCDNEVKMMRLKNLVNNDRTKQKRLAKYILEEQVDLSTELSTEESFDDKENKGAMESHWKCAAL